MKREKAVQLARKMFDIIQSSTTSTGGYSRSGRDIIRDCADVLAAYGPSYERKPKKKTCSTKS